MLRKWFWHSSPLVIIVIGSQPSGMRVEHMLLETKMWREFWSVSVIYYLRSSEVNTAKKELKCRLKQVKKTGSYH